MASNLFLILVLASLSSLAHSQTPLSVDYYAKTCPRLDQIIQETVTNKQTTNPVTAAATLRIFFHDCMVDGCDASVLIGSVPNGKAEKENDMNESLAGDGFDVVTRAKTALELACPGVVSCADILALTTRNLVKMVGGPFYNVSLGRKDGLVSDAKRVDGNLARANFSMDTMIKQFEGKGLNVEDMVASTGGGHTIGFSHCKEFSDRIFNFSKTADIDPALDPAYAARLKQLCANYQKDGTIAAFNDVKTPGQFDNMFFKNLFKGWGLLASDHLLIADPRTKPLCEKFAKSETEFFQAFAKAMVKISMIGIKTGNDGEIRHRCDKFNTK
ncbi:peroxidase 41-like [Cornus florida]|uniref:peroxidase 41-like n=1 Tax=Cornus florida TaxID=4283 RepID=UPI00289C84B5|nr:peroxidase 41-like [Cornus florida]